LPNEAGVEVRYCAVLVVLVGRVYSLIVTVLAVKRLAWLWAWNFRAVGIALGLASVGKGVGMGCVPTRTSKRETIPARKRNEVVE
jgi:hypothetical protein